MNPNQLINRTTDLGNARKLGVLMLWPAALWAFAFIAVPLVYVVVLAFLRRSPYGAVVWEFSLTNFFRSFDPLYLRILFSSLKMAIGVTLAAALIGVPTAYAMARARPHYRNLLLFAIMLPFFTNFILRAWAIRSLLGNQGPLPGLLTAFGLDSALYLNILAGPIAVWIGMVTNYLPFILLPVYVAFEKFDWRLLDAARDLGAKPMGSMWHVLLPNTSQAILSGSMLVFVPAMGEFLIPDFLGGARVMLIGNLVTDQFLKSRDWPFGAAIVVQVVVVTAAVWLLLRSLLRLRGGNDR